ncbi:MAG: elongation factor G [Planctomycetota bacterium]|nr:MAG: elongation factor G [Planctomycetota bacterium]
MEKFSSADIRNLALIGGPATGKTTLTEALLFKSGAIARMGSVGDGTTVTDFGENEKAKQHSLRLGLVHTTHKGNWINVLDAPGYPDFVGEAASALAAAEVAVLVVHAAQGITFPSHKIWDLAARNERVRCVVVTNLDHGDGEWSDLVTNLSESLGARCLSLSVPDQLGAGFGAVQAVPLGGRGESALARERDALVEAIVEVDEDAMVAFLEADTSPEPAVAANLLKRSMLSGDVVPVFAVHAEKDLGVDVLLDTICAAFPSPLDGPFFHDVNDEPVEPVGEGASAFVFKTIVDNFVGKLCLLRVVTGSIAPGDSLVHSQSGKPVKLGHLEVLQGKEHKAAHGLFAGDIAAVTKIEELETNDSLHAADTPHVFRKLVVPKPMAVRAIQPVNHADELKLATALRRASSESPSFSYERNEDTHELLVHGTSLMQIEMELKRIKDRAGIEVAMSVPRVALKETINAPADGHHRHKKQTGGRGQFAEVFLSIEPGERGSGLEFVDATVGGSVPRQFVPAVEKGVREMMQTGIVAGYPVVDVIVKLKDGKFHDVDSDEASFKRAGARAFKDAFTKARPALLEPVLDVQVAVPSRFMGAITSDMTTRRGHISGMDSLGDVQLINAHVPQLEVLTYPTVLHSLTSGEGSFSAEFHDYGTVPANVQKKLMAEYNPVDDDE